mmetsp:Transcript_85396/g.183008  ORF Transcript_85396/g.183008 Transcript_85396/m.183008 type:complete len:201 (-) Transcript_85396:1339-1941(-)
MEAQAPHLLQRARPDHVEAVDVALAFDEGAHLRGDVPSVHEDRAQEEHSLCARGAAAAEAIGDHGQVHVVCLLVGGDRHHAHALATTQDPSLRLARERRPQDIGDPRQEPDAESADGLKSAVLLRLAAHGVLQKLGEDVLVHEVAQAHALRCRVLDLQAFAIQRHKIHGQVLIIEGEHCVAAVHGAAEARLLVKEEGATC